MSQTMNSFLPIINDDINDFKNDNQDISLQSNIGKNIENAIKKLSIDLSLNDKNLLESFLTNKNKESTNVNLVQSEIDIADSRTIKRLITTLENSARMSSPGISRQQQSSKRQSGSSLLEREPLGTSADPKFSIIKNIDDIAKAITSKMPSPGLSTSSSILDSLLSKLRPTTRVQDKSAGPEIEIDIDKKKKTNQQNIQLERVKPTNKSKDIALNTAKKVATKNVLKTGLKFVPFVGAAMTAIDPVGIVTDTADLVSSATQLGSSALSSESEIVKQRVEEREKRIKEMETLQQKATENFKNNRADLADKLSDMGFDDDEIDNVLSSAESAMTKSHSLSKNVEHIGGGIGDLFAFAKEKLGFAEDNLVTPAFKQNAENKIKKDEERALLMQQQAITSAYNSSTQVTHINNINNNSTGQSLIIPIPMKDTSNIGGK